jgi:hypothetical protein
MRDACAGPYAAAVDRLRRVALGLAVGVISAGCTTFSPRVDGLPVVGAGQVLCDGPACQDALAEPEHQWPADLIRRATGEIDVRYPGHAKVVLAVDHPGTPGSCDCSVHVVDFTLEDDTHHAAIVGMAGVGFTNIDDPSLIDAWRYFGFP